MKYISKRKIILMVIDLFIIFFSYVLAIFVRFQTDFQEMTKYFSPVFIYPFISVIIYYFTGVYNNIWRFAGLTNLFTIFTGGFLGFLANFVFFEFTRRYITDFFILPFSVAFIAALIGVVFISMSRMLWVASKDGKFMKNINKSKASRKILIVGAGDAGLEILREYEKNPSEGYVIGFIDDDINKIGRNINGYKIFDNTSNIMKYAEEFQITEIIIAIPSAGSETIKRIISGIDTSKVKIKTLPSIIEILNNKLSLGFLRDVDISDLLGRKEVKVNLDEIENYISGKHVLITGAGGSIGSELARQIAALKPEVLYFLGRGENSIFKIKNEIYSKFPDLKTEEIICDITNYERLSYIFGKFTFDVVFHAAAHKHVPLMEKNPLEAFNVNTLGTYYLAELSGKYKVKNFIFISTDKAINPTSIMGTSKRFGEIVIRSIAEKYETKYGMVRFGNVLGSRGSVIPIFKEQIRKGGPVTVTHKEMKRYFMTIPEAASLVLQTGNYSSKGEIFILDMGEPVYIDDLARNLIRLSGFIPDQDIEIRYSGIRPGEKLFEELFSKDEKYTKTQNSRIFIVESENKINENHFQEVILKIKNAIHENNYDEIEELIREYIPEAKSYIKRDMAI